MLALKIYNPHPHPPSSHHIHPAMEQEVNGNIAEDEEQILNVSKIIAS